MLINIAGAFIAFVLTFVVVFLFLETGRIRPKKPARNRIAENKETVKSEQPIKQTLKKEKVKAVKSENKKASKNQRIKENAAAASGTGVNLLITRKEIAEYARSLNNEHISVSEHKDIQVPVSLKWKKRTFGMLYAADDGILAVLALDGESAERIKQSHKDLHKPAFPKGAHWYGLTINNLTFKSKQEVYQLLDKAIEYVESVQK